VREVVLGDERAHKVGRGLPVSELFMGRDRSATRLSTSSTRARSAASSASVGDKKPATRRAACRRSVATASHSQTSSVAFNRPSSRPIACTTRQIEPDRLQERRRGACRVQRGHGYGVQLSVRRVRVSKSRKHRLERGACVPKTDNSQRRQLLSRHSRRLVRTVADLLGEGEHLRAIGEHEQRIRVKGLDHVGKSGVPAEFGDVGCLLADRLDAG
jgi:hypothetical protein